MGIYKRFKIKKIIIKDPNVGSGFVDRLKAIEQKKDLC